jgi:hypothetical protein
VLLESDDDLCYKTELLIDASTAIRSSLGTEGANDLATRLAVRLLLPHVKIDSDLRITANLVNTLEHYSPKSDADAKGLLSLCRKLAERKNVRVLDGCDSICLARFMHYTRERRPGGAIDWLLQGIELESFVFCDGPRRSGSWQRSLSSGVCYRRLVSEFTETSQSLLKTLHSAEHQGASLLFARASQMVAAVEQSSLTPYVPAIQVLANVVLMADAISHRKDDSIVANAIVACLEEKANDEDDGCVSSLSSPSMYWDLLRLAAVMLDRDSAERTSQPTSSFDVKGMSVLLSTFTTVTRSFEMEKRAESIVSESDLLEMRLALGEGLKRAFVVENHTKSTRNRKPKALVSGMYASNFARHSREEQEREVAQMLSY